MSASIQEKPSSEAPAPEKMSKGSFSAESGSQLNEMTSIELADEAALAACGYKQEFKREFNLFSTFSVSFAVLGVLPSVASTLSYSLGYSGTAGLTWGWLVAFVGIQCVACSMAELASSMPTSGGLYYCVGVLAPKKWAPLLAYLTGWSNWLGLVAGSPSINYGNASMITAMATLHNPDFVTTNGKLFGISLALTFMCSVMTALPTRWVARINNFQTWIQLIGFLVVLIGLPAGARGNPKFQPSKKVWGEITNSTEWPDGIAILMSFLTAIWTMSGYDAPFHLSEECSNSQVATPRAIVATSALGGSLGWFLVLVISYVITDIDGVLSSDLGQPWIALLAQVLPTNTTTAFGALTIVCGFFCAQGCSISSSRLAFAYARDGLLPGSKWVSTVHPKIHTPVNATIFNFLVSTAMLCLIFAGDLAVAAIFSIGAVGAYFAFIMPVVMRCFFAGDRWKPGPWTLGRWSLPIGYFGCAYVLLMLPILCFPAVRGADLNAQSMNWTVVVWGGPLLLATIFFALHAHKTYKGPKINIEHLNLPDGTRLTVEELQAEKTADFRKLVHVTEMPV